MKTVISKIYKCVTDTRVYTLSYLLVCMLWFFPLLGDVFDIFSKICFVWGALFIGIDLLTTRKCMKSRNFFLIFIMLAAYAVGVLLTIRNGFDIGTLYGGVKNIIYNGILLLIIYAQDSKNSLDKIKKTFYAANQMIITIVCVAGILSLGMFIFDIGFTFYKGSILFRQGFLENRLYGVYTSSNVGALFAIVSIAAAGVNALLQNRIDVKQNILKFNKKLYVVNIIVQILYFSLTLSRGGQVTLYALIIAVCVFLQFARLLKKMNIFKAAIITFLTIIIAIVGSNLVISTARTTLTFFPNTIRYINYMKEHEKVEESTEDDEFKGIELERIESGDDVSNGRFAIWEAGISIFKQEPLFGIGNARIYENDVLINTFIDEDKLTEGNKHWLKWANGNMHSVYVQILVYSGVLGFGLFVLIALATAKRFLLFIYRTDTDTTEYKIVALILSVIVAFVANGVIETHLLFDRQDPFGVIFWLYVGVGELLIYHYSKRQEIKRQTKDTADVAIACDTPVQVLNAIRLINSQAIKKDETVDIYIYHQFKGSRDVSEKIKQLNIFENVYDVEKYAEGNKINTLCRLMFPRYTVNRHSHKKISFWKKNYSKCFLAAETPFTISLKMAIDNVKLFFYEEGTASYFVNTNDNVSRIFSIIDEFVFGGRIYFNPEKLYVSNARICNNTLADEHESIGDITKKTIEELEAIFTYKKHQSYENKMIYLVQPIHELCDRLLVNEEDLIKNLISKKIVVRNHPRYEIELQDVIQDSGNMWELECLKGKISDEHILISCFSTAQFMPKILVDCEPVLVFTYQIFLDEKELQNEKWKNIINLVDELKRMYKNPERIFVPKSMDELNHILGIM